ARARAEKTTSATLAEKLPDLGRVRRLERLGVDLAQPGHLIGAEVAAGSPARYEALDDLHEPLLRLRRKLGLGFTHHVLQTRVHTVILGGGLILLQARCGRLQA